MLHTFPYLYILIFLYIATGLIHFHTHMYTYYYIQQGPLFYIIYSKGPYFDWVHANPCYKQTYKQTLQTNVTNKCYKQTLQTNVTKKGKQLPPGVTFWVVPNWWARTWDPLWKTTPTFSQNWVCSEEVSSTGLFPLGEGFRAINMLRTSATNKCYKSMLTNVTNQCYTNKYYKPMCDKQMLQISVTNKGPVTHKCKCRMRPVQGGEGGVLWKKAFYGTRHSIESISAGNSPQKSSLAENFP